MSTVAAFDFFFIRFSGASEHNPKMEFFGFIMIRKRLLFRVHLAPDKSYDSAMRKRTHAISLYRSDPYIYGGSRGQKETFVRGNGVPRDLWHCTFSLSFFFNHFSVAIAISSTIAIIIAACGSERFCSQGWVSSFLSFLWLI